DPSTGDAAVAPSTGDAAVAPSTGDAAVAPTAAAVGGGRATPALPSPERGGPGGAVIAPARAARRVPSIGTAVVSVEVPGSVELSPSSSDEAEWTGGEWSPRRQRV